MLHVWSCIMLRSGHLPDPPLEVLPGHPCSQAPTTSHMDSICTWCNSDVIFPDSDREFPWMHVFHQLLLFAARNPVRRPVSLFGLICCCQLLTGLVITTTLVSCFPIYGSSPPVRHPPVPTHLYTDSLCVPVDSLAFEDPSLDIPVATRNGCWLNITAVMARFLCCSCPTSFPLPPPLSQCTPMPPLVLLTPLLPWTF
jgi:hypothetical protein